MKQFLRQAGLALAFAAAAATGGRALAQPAIDKPVHLVVPFAAGGATDAIGRVIGRRMADILGQPVVIENKPGAGGTLGIGYAARAQPDSNTIVLVNALQHTSAVKLYPNLRYDAITSFRPLAAIGTVRYMLLVNPGFEAKDYDAFLKQVRSQPGKYSYASAGVGSAPHLVMELFARTEGLSMVHVPYNGSAPAMTDLVANHVPIAMDNVAAVPFVKSGRLRALATSGPRRDENFPDVPTFTERGWKGPELVGQWGFLAPAGMPDRTAGALGDAIARAMQDTGVLNALLAQGIQPEHGTSARFGATLTEEAAKWSRLIDDARIKL